MKNTPQAQPKSSHANLSRQQKNELIIKHIDFALRVMVKSIRSRLKEVTKCTEENFRFLKIENKENSMNFHFQFTKGNPKDEWVIRFTKDEKGKVDYSKKGKIEVI